MKLTTPFARTRPSLRSSPRALDSLNPVLIIVMEFVDGGSLCDFIALETKDMGSTLSHLLTIWLGSTRGLDYLHSMDPPVIHRDIKSENILLTQQYEAKIADLGEATALDDGQRKMTMVGTQGYTAPEVLRGEHYGTPADVFSLGIVLCECLSRSPPYEDMLTNDKGENIASWQQIIEMTKQVGLRPTLPPGLDPRIESLVEDMLVDDAQLRPSAALVQLRLQEISRNVKRRKGKGESSRSQRRRIEEERAPVAKLCRTLYEHLWETQDIEADERIMAEDATATANDSVYKEILRSTRGPSVLRLVWV